MTSSGATSPNLVILGGAAEDLETQDKCRILDKRGKNWKVLTKLPEKLSAISVCQTDDGFVISGGRNEDLANVSSCYQFVASTRVWKRLADLLTARFGAASMMIEGCVYIIGGAERQSGNGEQVPVNYCQSLNLNGNVWNKHIPMLQGMAYPIAVAINGIIFVIFSDQGLNKGFKFGDRKTLQMYNSQTNEWSYGEALPDDVERTAGASPGCRCQRYHASGGRSRWTLCPVYPQHQYMDQNC